MSHLLIDDVKIEGQEDSGDEDFTTLSDLLMDSYYEYECDMMDEGVKSRSGEGEGVEHKQKLVHKIEEWKKILKNKPIVTDELDKSSPNYFYLNLTDREKENIEKAKTDSAEVLTVMKGHCKWRKHSTRKMMIQPCEEKKENDDEVKVE